MAEGGRILGQILSELKKETKINTNGQELNQKADEMIRQRGATPSFLNYRGYPATLCVSINHGLVHGLPNDTAFKNGDLVSLDLGLRYQDLCLDKAISFIVGQTDQHKQKFLDIVLLALKKSIQKAVAGGHLGEISHQIQTTIESSGYSIAQGLYGHGVGKNVHESPNVPNFGEKSDGPVLQNGMVLAIEPMACMGKGQITVGDDNQSIYSLDGSLCGHFEDTVAITKNGPKVLTKEYSSDKI